MSDVRVYGRLEVHLSADSPLGPIERSLSFELPLGLVGKEDPLYDSEIHVKRWVDKLFSDLDDDVPYAFDSMIGALTWVSGVAHLLQAASSHE